jgi:hypothetical protein
MFLFEKIVYAVKIAFELNAIFDNKFITFDKDGNWVTTFEPCKGKHVSEQEFWSDASLYKDKSYSKIRRNIYLQAIYASNCTTIVSYLTISINKLLKNISFNEITLFGNKIISINIIEGGFNAKFKNPIVYSVCTDGIYKKPLIIAVKNNNKVIGFPHNWLEVVTDNGTYIIDVSIYQFNLQDDKIPFIIKQDHKFFSYYQAYSRTSIDNDKQYKTGYMLKIISVGDPNSDFDTLDKKIISQIESYIPINTVYTT